MTRESYLGRGFEPIPGKPFGWAWNQERREIRAHMIRRGWNPRDLAFEFRVTAIQTRLNREHPKRWAAKVAAWRSVKAPPPAEPAFDREELSRLVELFSAANDPVTASIAAKAAAMLARLS